MQHPHLLSLGRNINMKQYIVKITDKAFADMEEIYNYIAEQLQTPENGIKQYNRIAKAIEKLDVFPERFAIMKSQPGYLMGLRRLIIDNFSVFYFIEDDSVIIIRILYSASDIDRRLNEG